MTLSSFYAPNGNNSENNMKQNKDKNKNKNKTTPPQMLSASYGEAAVMTCLYSRATEELGIDPDSQCSHAIPQPLTTTIPVLPITASANERSANVYFPTTLSKGLNQASVVRCTSRRRCTQARSTSKTPLSTYIYQVATSHRIASMSFSDFSHSPATAYSTAALSCFSAPSGATAPGAEFP